jgi:type IV secretion system protein VirB9
MTVPATPTRSAWGGASIVALVATAMVHGSQATAEEAPDPRLRVVDYRPTLVVPLTVFVGYHVHLEFAPDEFFVNLGAGDTSSLDVGAEGNHLLLKPKQATAGTNLTILTNRRAYFVDYRALARQPHADEAVYSIVFRYPDSRPIAGAAPRDSTAVDTRLAAPGPPLNQDYWFCGSASLRPIAAADDGLQLRLTFAPHAALPAVFAAEPDGQEILVNTHVEDDMVVVHRLAKRFVLRRGREVGCIVDRAPHRSERRAEAGTVDRGVARTTREPPQ